MSSKLLAVAAALTLASPALAEQAAFPRNPNIVIDYVRPSDGKLSLVHDRMRQLGVLQTLQEFLSPLQLTRKITVTMNQCGGQLSLPYKPQAPVTICYEHLNLIRVTAPVDEYISFVGDRKLTADQAVAGGVARLMLYETAFAVFDVLNIPIWGRVEEAADNLTALIMLDFGEELAWTTILGSAWYLAQRGLAGAGFFSDAVRPQEAQRFYNYLCIAYGKLPKTYEFLVNNFNLPADRAKLCKEEYFKLSRAFRTVFKDRIDPVLLRQVKARQDWLAH